MNVHHIIRGDLILGASPKTNNNLAVLNYCNDIFFRWKNMIYSPKANMMVLFHKNDGFAVGKNVGSRFAA